MKKYLFIILFVGICYSTLSQTAPAYLSLRDQNDHEYLVNSQEVYYIEKVNLENNTFKYRIFIYFSFIKDYITLDFKDIDKRNSVYAAMWEKLVPNGLRIEF